ncbi:hypothetical protein LPJ70_004618 [Coemansia sp. RSA 2708]|nr:hypothetical protein LPJ70_004618 [Coemansia sp. RSA 2708]
MSDTEAARPAKRKTSAQIKRANREKLRILREGAIETQQHAHQYLTTWSTDRANWKFNKARQLWIIRHLYVDAQVPSPVFDTAVQYLAESSDTLRQCLLEDARLVANPAAATTEELQAKRTRVLGLMPSHVTKGEARAIKLKKKKLKQQQQSQAVDANQSEGGSGGEKKEKKQDDGAEQNDDNAEPEVAEVAVSTRERAERIIEAMFKPKPMNNAEPAAAVSNSASEFESDSKTSKKRKSDDGDKKSKKARKDKKEKSEKKDKKDSKKSKSESDE